MAELVHHLLESAARTHPGHPAVRDRGRVLTYSELDRRANRLAHVLVGAGAGPGDRVGILLEKSADAVACLYAVMKAGAAYVPLDPLAPPHRLAQIAADCDLRRVMTDRRDVDLGGAALIDPGGPDVDVAPEHPLERRATADELAYILYTSGSTGAPKGVAISHANALAFVEWASAAFHLTATDRLSSHAPFHFDLSVFDLYASAAVGATVVLVPPEASVFPRELRRFIEREGVTVWYSVPSILTLLAVRGGLAPGDLPDLRTVLFAGEVFPTKYLRRLMATLPHARFANLYGPTETNVCTWYEVDEPPASDTEPIPIGRPAAGARLALTGAGELLVQGATVARGYWNDPARTASRFVTDPRPDLPGRWYCTGDLVEQRPDGRLLYLGRRDGQVKSRGYRIELGDVEAAVYGHPAVVECAVVAVPDDLVTARIHAFVVVDGDVAQADLMRWTAGRLPRSMVPESFTFCTALPRTATGKTDRQALVRGGRP